MTSKAPEERYDSAAALAADLRRWLEGRPVLARSLGPLGRLACGLRRHPLLAALLVGLLVEERIRELKR